MPNIAAVEAMAKAYAAAHTVAATGNNNYSKDQNCWSLNSFWMRPIDLPAELAVGANKYIRLRFTMLPTCQWKYVCQWLICTSDEHLHTVRT